MIGRSKTFIMLDEKSTNANCDLTLDHDVIKRRLKQAKPVSVKTVLSSHLEPPFEQFEKLADTIYSYYNTVVATSPQNVSSDSTADANKTILQSAFNEKQPISEPIKIKQISQDYTPFTACQRPKNNQAKSCKVICQWPGQKPKTKLVRISQETAKNIQAN